MRSAGIAAAIVIALVAIGATGCGGGDDSGTTTEAISKEDFLAQGNEVCAEGNKTFDAATKDAFGGGEPTKAEMTKFVDETAIPTIQGEIDGIRALGIPAGDEDQVNAILDSAQEGVDALKADPALLSSEKQDPFAEANKLAAEYGLTECGGG